jgi:hypothetical protein
MLNWETCLEFRQRPHFFSLPRRLNWLNRSPVFLSNECYGYLPTGLKRPGREADQKPKCSLAMYFAAPETYLSKEKLYRPSWREVSIVVFIICSCCQFLPFFFLFWFPLFLSLRVCCFASLYIAVCFPHFLKDPALQSHVRLVVRL